MQIEITGQQMHGSFWMPKTGSESGWNIYPGCLLVCLFFFFCSACDLIGSDSSTKKLSAFVL